MKAKYNSGEAVDYEACGQVSTCANALKAFFRDLVQPVINTAAYKLIIELMDASSQKKRVAEGSSGGGENDAVQAAAIQAIFQNQVTSMTHPLPFWSTRPGDTLMVVLLRCPPCPLAKRVVEVPPSSVLSGVR